MARGNVGKFGMDLVKDAPVAAGYAIGANYLMRKAGLSYGSRAAVSVVAGGVIGYGLVQAGFDNVGKTVAVTGVAAGIIYGASEIGTRMFLGSPDSRQALATGTTPTSTGTPATTGGAAMPALGPGRVVVQAPSVAAPAAVMPIRR